MTLTSPNFYCKRLSINFSAILVPMTTTLSPTSSRTMMPRMLTTEPFSGESIVHEPRKERALA
ncbi:uncharacterized protein HD556DRAFT_1448022 [Suillus plorans]|uniref:Uncharacterized protein n=1 Tax=Suillus plorans TaxID=116603 RepID=A0A9P7AGC6_9AGAM|nr:uncharacterized protein HD556DRAFT_1448022 [Suillus plorans]KAG1788218.1 hypothetical protein HD556DRAFT_1448022 [Suillus plorans]